ncbi:MAG: YARHG domain-containing protein [Muribaculaceae bacterium]|nr:YARHG domain-containing protein [Muribaculaceae bacterium]
MKKYLIFAATVFLSLQVMAATLGNINDTYWHDGFASYRATQKGGVISFTGGTLHEGGYDFKVVKGRGGKMVVKSVYDAMNYITTPGRSVSGSSIERRSINGQDMLIITSPQGKITDVLLAMNGDFDTALKEQLNQQLDGVYRDNNGQYYSFDGFGRMSIGDSKAKLEPFSFVYIYETPSNVIDFPALKKHYSFEPQGQNFKFDEVKTVDGMSWDEDPGIETIKSAKINKLRGLRYSGDGLWPITSAEILTSGYFECYSADDLRLMRNDIYARHGYKFKDSSLRNIFEKQSWYKPVTSNANSLKFNEVERINIALIQNMEKIKAQNDF